jgi:hypothetical protein
LQGSEKMMRGTWPASIGETYNPTTKPHWFKYTEGARN